MLTAGTALRGWFSRGDPMDTEKLHVYSEAEIPAKLSEQGLTAWYLEDGWLRRKFTTDGWPTTLMLVNAVGYLAEAAWHHPDLSVTWGKVWIKLKTHSAGGITDKDFALAKQIEAAVLWRPPADSPLQGTPNKFVKGS
jgi:4a-hydroxytetrahydrobiopterin dehydratase